MERLSVVFAILKSLAQCKLQINFILARKVWIFIQRLHFGQLIVIETIDLEVSE